MRECISIKSDYSLLSSMIRLSDLFIYASNNNYDSIGIIDDNLSYVAEFIKLSKQYNIKPIIGLDVKIDDFNIYLYAKNYNGYLKLLDINSKVQCDSFNIDLIDDNILVIIPYIYKDRININNAFIGCTSDIDIDNKIYFKVVLSLSIDDSKYINYLNMIKGNLSYNNYQDIDYRDNCIYVNDQSNFTSLINIEFPKNENLIPHYSDDIKDSYKYLEQLSYMGLKKRLNNNIPQVYIDRLKYELDIINKMNYTDYFLIVYDYVKFAIKSGIYVGPGRGSAVGSLTTYCLGITSVDPLKYGLLFERFLNPERVTMPDIDIDFDADKRDLVIDYVKDRYGNKKVMPVMTYGTLTCKLALNCVSKILDVDIKPLNKYIDSKKSLKDNLSNELMSFLNVNVDIKRVYLGAMKIEGIKRHISTNAAGVVICKKDIDRVIPIINLRGEFLTGFTKDYLEDLGLLKMDFLSIKNLTIISNILEDVNINLNNIPLDDPLVYRAFCDNLTCGIFQFDTSIMKYLLTQIKPSCFDDLIVSLALIRPGASKYIDTYARRKFGKEKISYIDNSLEGILKPTNGIIIYQEQIMQIFTKCASYSFAEADLIRRAISKKNEGIILGEKDKFISRAVNNGYSVSVAQNIFDNVLRFAEYGFNKSHSVGYAYLAYQMMYLKVHYPVNFYNILIKLNIYAVPKEIIDEAKNFNIKLSICDVNTDMDNSSIMVPFTLIKGVSSNAAKEIIKNKPYNSFFDFVSKNYGSIVNKDVIENLIYAGCLDSFGYNRNTLLNNINSALIYSELVKGLDSSLVSVPSMEIFDEFDSNYLIQKEYEMYGFYVSNHPSSKYNCVKSINLSKYFDRRVEVFGIITRVKNTKTKKGDSMAFITLNDEYGNIDCTIFPGKMAGIKCKELNKFVRVCGVVQRRLDKYQIVVDIMEAL